MQISFTLELTPENLDKLKAFCENTDEAPVKAPAKKTASKPKAKPTTEKETAEEPKPEEKAPAKAKPTITMTDVRAVALKISKAGKSDALKEIFAKFDATKLSEVPADRYDELMQELSEVDA